MTRFIFKRALDSTVALFGLLIVVFFLTRMTGDPASLYLPENATEQDRIEFAIRNGYADPIPVQFGRYVLGLLQFDFGRSITQQRPAMDAVLEAAPTTAKLASVSMLVTIALSVLIGCLAASRPNGVFDRLATSISLGGASAPDFWIAIVGILVFAVYLRWLPTSGSGGIEYWIMPVFIVALRPVALLTQVVRGAMISALSAPYVKTARAKGLSKQTIIFQHALRSSLLPTITVAGDLFVGMINGSIIAETVFGLRGLGKVLIDAIFQRDFAVVQSAVLFVAVAIFVLNIVIDIVYALVDPRDPVQLAMANLSATAPIADDQPSQLAVLGRMLLRDRFALIAAIFLVLVTVGALIGPYLFGELATKVNLRQRNLPPFTLDNGLLYILGADSLGRSLLARIIVGAQTSLAISACVVVVSMIVGGTLGIVAGYVGGWTSTIIMRLTDVIFSFPSLLMALIVLYILGPSILNVIAILSVTRLPIYIRTTRAEVLEIRERMFVSAARALGVSTPNILLRHVLPVVFPTIITIGAVDFSSVLLSESGLSFLGLGIQPPDFTWGAMVATGRAYLQTAWWLSFWPGLMIMLTTLSLNLLANWARMASDPQQRWRLQGKRRVRR